jgi:hypothetical protein
VQARIKQIRRRSGDVSVDGLANRLAKPATTRIECFSANRRAAAEFVSGSGIAAPPRNGGALTWAGNTVDEQMKSGF